MRRITALISLLLLAGCANSYVTPGRGADMAAFGITPQTVATKSIVNKPGLQPTAKFPATLGVVRVQAPGYESLTGKGYGAGNFSLVSTADVAAAGELKPLSKLPMIGAVLPAAQLTLAGDLKTDQDLLQATAPLKADLLLVYTLDTTFKTSAKETPLSQIALVEKPTTTAQIATTAAAAVIDAKSGFVYAVLETAARCTPPASAFATAQSSDELRQKTEAKAFSDLLASFERTWPRILQQYCPRTR